jgi:Skp family chaperone for outer membrane proteins
MKKRLAATTVALLAASAFTAAPPANAGVVCQTAGNVIFKYVGPLGVYLGEIEQDIAYVCRNTP